MIRNVLAALRWSVSLGAKFLTVVPGATTVVVFATLISQVALLLALFLPLKVIILLGSDSVPRYFPPSMMDLGRDWLILTLSAAAGGCYVVYLLSERVVRFGADYGARRLLAQSKKMNLFENQDELAASAYQRYSRALAGSVFVGLTLIALGMVYPALAVLLACYAMLVLVAFGTAHRLSATFRNAMVVRLSPMLSIANAVGFLIVFAYLVADFILWSPPGVIIAIISLLLARQALIRASGMVADTAMLSRQRVKLDALFFHSKVLLEEQPQGDGSIWQLLASQSRTGVVTTILSELVGSDPTDQANTLECHWYQTGILNVPAFQVRTSPRFNFLVKFFDVNRSVLALHEATLLAEPPGNIPALAFLGATQIQEFHCHVFELPVVRRIETRDLRQAADRIRADLLTVEPPVGIEELFRRSRPMLWQRLDRDLLERLKVAAEDRASLELVERFGASFSELQSRLQELPLHFSNPDLTADTIVVDDRGNHRLTHWGRWTLEPLGAGWPEDGLPQLTSALQAGVPARRSLANVLAVHVELGALSFALERESLRQRYATALGLLPELLDRLDALRKSPGPLQEHDREAV